MAVALPGWRWMPGMRVRNGDVRQWGTLAAVHPDGHVDYWDPEFEELLTGKHPSWLDIDPDDPATAGCLLALLGPCEVAYDDDDPLCGPWSVAIPHHFRMAPTIGRACVAAAEALGRWPGGDL